MTSVEESGFDKRARTRELATEFAERGELSRFEACGLVQTQFEVMPDDSDDEPADRLVVMFRR